MIKSPLLRCGSTIVLIFSLLGFLWWLFPGLFAIWDLQVEDQVMRFTYDRQGARPTSPDIVHIDLDDQSAASLDYDKNDPRLYTELIRILKKSGVRTILIDMVFPYCRDDNACAAFAREVADAGNVFFPLILSNNGAPSKTDPQNPWQVSVDQAIWNITGTDAFTPIRGEITMSNLPELNAAAAGLGHINCPPDLDGVYRRLPLIISTAKGPIPSIALRTASSYLDVSPDQIRIPDRKNIIMANARFPDGRRADITIPVDGRGRNRINFSATWNNAFNHYSFAAVINTGATPDGLLLLTDELEGSLAVVSDVSTGSRDFGPIPLSSYFPLSGLHSHFINSILEQEFFLEAGASYRLALDVLLIILLAWAAVYLRGARFCLAAGFLYACLLLAGIYLFMEQRVLVPVVRPSLSFILAVPAIMLVQFFEVQKEKQYIRGRLTHYFAPSLMDKILKQPELLNTVEKKELTVLFSDIVGFTSWSSTRDAQEIHRTLNRYFEEMADIVFAHQGTIDKYMGDGLLVFFGDPVPCENHPLLAVQTAIAMQEKAKELRADWEQSGGMPLTIRVGIHTGEVVVGNMGSSSRMEYTVIGSNVNLAQRLESNCRPGSILISQEVYSRLNGDVPARPDGTIEAKGFREPIPVYTIAG
ncbi:MAG: adenylate/guanylate cyclase domain-containing protein [Desulfobulbaceae bacterium]|nr:adenylate/guanylate cyclase domain-containing protein [Desulfobulbaceae bacterium]